MPKIQSQNHLKQMLELANICKGLEKLANLSPFENITLSNLNESSEFPCTLEFRWFRYSLKMDGATMTDRLVIMNYFLEFPEDLNLFLAIWPQLKEKVLEAFQRAIRAKEKSREFYSLYFNSRSEITREGFTSVTIQNIHDANHYEILEAVIVEDLDFCCISPSLVQALQITNKEGPIEITDFRGIKEKKFSAKLRVWFHGFSLIVEALIMENVEELFEKSFVLSPKFNTDIN